jgi:hypothetical protein
LESQRRFPDGLVAWILVAGCGESMLAQEHDNAVTAQEI